ncbi:MAG: lipopolysaccharide biosynthesis protein [Deltaproteobacteria bacterium]|nr:lipopolysaccharide biosynthesis protein [Deltaproteobacteria bacterium]
MGRRTRHALSWSLVAAVATNVVRLGVVAALGRLLTPGDFGVVAAAMTLIIFANLLRDFGVGYALVQRAKIEPEHVEAAFTVSVIQGVVLTLIVAAAAAPFAELMGVPQATTLLRVLSLLFLVRSCAIVPNCMLQRALRFRATSMIDVAGYAVGSVTSVALAVAGYGPWALVGGYFVETLTGMVLLVWLSPPPVRLRWHPRHLRDLLGFGIGQSLATIVNYFAVQGDYLVVGNVLDKVQLGLYQRAYELMRLPANVFSSVAGSVLFSALSKVQDDPDRLGRVVRRSSFASALVLLPASVMLIVLAPEMIRILLGSQWDGAVWPFRVMATTMLFRTTSKLGILVARSSGDVFAIAKWQVVYAVAVIGGAAVSVQWGILGVATTTTVAIVINYVTTTWIGLARTTLTVRELAAAHVVPLLIALAVGGVSWSVAAALRAAGVSYVVVAAASVAAGGLVFVAFIYAGVRRATGDWPWLRETFVAVFSRSRTRRSKAPATTSPPAP